MNHPSAVPFDAETYVKENKYRLAITDYSIIGKSLRCIDDRASNSEDRERDIAIPGAGLGLVMDVLGAFTLLRRKGKRAALSPQEAVIAVERAIGAIPFHTDDHHEGHASLCAGCGHAHGALTDPASYLLTEEDARYFFEFCLSDLKDKLHSKGLAPVIYRGPHAAKAVMIVEGTDVGLPSVSKSGDAVFVYHKTFHEILLTLVANQIVSLLGENPQEVGERELEETIYESARIRLGVTVNKLAAALPKFKVEHTQSLTVSLID